MADPKGMCCFIPCSKTLSDVHIVQIHKDREEGGADSSPEDHDVIIVEVSAVLSYFKGS